VIGWAGNSQGVVACLGASFWVDTGTNGPGSGSTAPVTGTTYGYGVYDDSPTTWANSGGYLPALVTTRGRRPAPSPAPKTGDLSFVKANFDSRGPAGTSEPGIKDTAHLIAADPTGPGGIMQKTNDIDADGYWTIDNYGALMGLAAYRWLAEQVGNTSEANWAAGQYSSLLAATNKTLNATIATYHYGFARLAGKLPPNTFGGYPTQYYSTAYNAGYGEWGLTGHDYRDQGILSYQFMVANGQNGPYSWWESQQFPNPESPWTGTHPASGNGSSPHAWGIANANMGLHSGLTIRTSGSQVTLTLTGREPTGPSS
jgi:hypothetical protein